MVKRLKVILLALFCSVIVVDFIWTSAQAQDQPAEKFFKNIKALKGVPQSQIAGLMDSYNKALGVSCDFCHVAGNLADDSKPAHKFSVRDIQMTREINDKYKHSVDCMSCHQGKAKPSSTVIAKGPDKPTQQPTQQPTQPTQQPTQQPAQSSGGAGPEMITFRAAALGASQVAFPHSTHQSIDCAKCHHMGGEPGKCTPCHKHNAGDAALAFKPISHKPTAERGCTGCHLQMKVGPSKCAQCHKK